MLMNLLLLFFSFVFAVSRVVGSSQHSNKEKRKKKEVDDVDNRLEHFNFSCGAFSLPEISRPSIALC